MSTNAIVVALATVISVFAVFAAPAFADDANKAAVLRDLGRNASQSVQAPDASALAAFASTELRPQGRARVIVNSPPRFDLNLIGHN